MHGKLLQLLHPLTPTRLIFVLLLFPNIHAWVRPLSTTAGAEHYEGKKLVAERWAGYALIIEAKRRRRRGRPQTSIYPFFPLAACPSPPRHRRPRSMLPTFFHVLPSMYESASFSSSSFSPSSIVAFKRLVRCDGSATGGGGKVEVELCFAIYISAIPPNSRNSPKHVISSGRCMNFNCIICEIVSPGFFFLLHLSK